MHIEAFLLVISLLFFVSIFTDKLSSKLGVPALLLFLGVGMLFGQDGFGIRFNDTESTQLIGSVSLCIILFAGGFSTRFRDIKPIRKEGVVLATIGVAVTWLLTGLSIYVVFRWFGFTEIMTMPFALLIAATMASTDASSVFSILGTKGIRLKHNLRPLLELESGSNDPMAYIITVTMIQVMTHKANFSYWQIPLDFLWSMMFGIAVGFCLAKLMIMIMKKVKLSNSSLYPIMILTACIFMYSASYYLGGNSYLAVYIGGLIIGNSKFPHKRQTLGFLDGMCWLAQLLMFLVLGLLVNPHELGAVILPGLLVSAIMILLARPVAVFMSLLPFRYTNQDKLFLSFVGLKGAVPIILAIQCAAEGVPDSDWLFNMTFACTLFSLLLQGSSLSWVAKCLRLTLPQEDRQQPTHFDIDLPDEIQEKAMELAIVPEMAPNGIKLQHLGLPKGALVIMMRRGDEYIIPQANTLLQPGDFLLLMTEQNTTLIHTKEQEVWQEQFIENTGEFIRNRLEERRRNLSGRHLRNRIYYFKRK